MDGIGKGRKMSIRKDNPWWKEEGIFCGGGWHPLSGRIRRNANYQTGFRKFLLDRYPSAELQRKRFGFTGFETFRAPNFYLRFSNPWDFDRFTNPLMQDWIDFRCWTVTDYIREMSACAKSLNPEIVIDSNGQSVWGSNQALLHGINQTQQLQHVDIVCEENPDWRADEEPDASPKVAHKFRGMNLARKLGKSVLPSFRDEESLAFNLCFSGNPGINMNWGCAEPKKTELNSAQPGVSELLRHFKEHKDLYCRSAPMARTY